MARWRLAMAAPSSSAVSVRNLKTSSSAQAVPECDWLQPLVHGLAAHQGLPGERFAGEAAEREELITAGAVRMCPQVRSGDLAHDPLAWNVRRRPSTRGLQHSCRRSGSWRTVTALTCRSVAMLCSVVLRRAENSPSSSARVQRAIRRSTAPPMHSSRTPQRLGVDLPPLGRGSLPGSTRP